MRHLKNPRGFTIIELIALLTIIGVLSAVAISRGLATDSYGPAIEADILKAHLRFAQARALSDEVSWGISFSGNSYTLLKNGAAAPYSLPNENSTTHTLQNGATITAGAGTVISFDKWGNPGAEDKTITISGLHTITVTKNTGFIP